jgi:hypothetical protein
MRRRAVSQRQDKVRRAVRTLPPKSPLLLKIPLHVSKSSTKQDDFLNTEINNEDGSSDYNFSDQVMDGTPFDENPQQGFVQKEAAHAGQDKNREFKGNLTVATLAEDPPDAKQVAHHHADGHGNEI